MSTARWSVVCDCGVRKTVFGSHLIQGNTTHCGCERKPPRNYQGVGGIPMTYYSQLKRSARGDSGRRAVMEMSVTIEDIAAVYAEQNGKCAYTGLPIDFKSNTASLDRIDSAKGYTIDNIQWVHKDINMMKRHYTEDYFVKLCSLVSGNFPDTKKIEVSP